MSILMQTTRKQSLRCDCLAFAMGLACSTLALISIPLATAKSAEPKQTVESALSALSKAPEEPPETIPAAPSPLVRPRLAYLAGGSTWNLSCEEFLQFLADYPKALLMRCPAHHLSSDAKFHYYEDYRLNYEWAFERAPEDNYFVKRSIWNRKAGDTSWRSVTSEATLAAPW